MSIDDAKPGDVLRDRDGDVWHIDEQDWFVCVVVNGRSGCNPMAGHSRESAQQFGPFVRLTPEGENATP